MQVDVVVDDTLFEASSQENNSETCTNFASNMSWNSKQSENNGKIDSSSKFFTGDNDYFSCR